MKMLKLKKSLNAGFTLIELIVVIVILGILAAVAIPKLTSTSESARAGVQDATLGALKSAWAIAYAKAKKAPTIAEIAAAMVDPGCTPVAGVITCTGVKTLKGDADAEFGTGATSNTTTVDIPSALTITKPGVATP